MHGSSINMVIMQTDMHNASTCLQLSARRRDSASRAVVGWQSVLWAERAASGLVALDVCRHLRHRTATTAASGAVVSAAASRDLEALARLGSGDPGQNAKHDVPKAAGEHDQDAEQDSDGQGGAVAHDTQAHQHLRQRHTGAKGDHEAVGHAVREAVAEADFPLADDDAQVRRLGVFDLDGLASWGMGKTNDQLRVKDCMLALADEARVECGVHGAPTRWVHCAGVAVQAASEKKCRFRTRTCEEELGLADIAPQRSDHACGCAKDFVASEGVHGANVVDAGQDEVDVPRVVLAPAVILVLDVAPDNRVARDDDGDLVDEQCEHHVLPHDHDQRRDQRDPVWREPELGRELLHDLELRRHLSNRDARTERHHGAVGNDVGEAATQTRAPSSRRGICREIADAISNHTHTAPRLPTKDGYSDN
ncbi:unnamed protein product [Phytophthora lilii]|uniref:Unnamed protein product n=1 Tax=Phytophthora lilii TaxID=2077276 RepID=A0A9W6U4I8_9STRA|nr:unnamed protein product [Phytophthora lilii]